MIDAAAGGELTPGGTAAGIGTMSYWVPEKPLMNWLG